MGRLHGNHSEMGRLSLLLVGVCASVLPAVDGRYGKGGKAMYMAKKHAQFHREAEEELMGPEGKGVGMSEDELMENLAQLRQERWDKFHGDREQLFKEVEESTDPFRSGRVVEFMAYLVGLGVVC